MRTGIAKYGILIVLLCCKICSCCAQQFDTLRGFNIYTIANAEMQQTLDEIISITDSCPYVSHIRKDYIIKLGFDTNGMDAMVHFMNTTAFAEAKYNPNSRNTGIAIYKHHYILISDYSQIDVVSQFFMRKDSILDLYLPPSENFFTHIPVARILLQLFYRIENNTLIMDTYDDKIECRRQIEFDYMVKQWDTWESIAKKCGCDVENLRVEYSEFINPIPGMCLFMLYIFDDNGHFIGVSRF